MRRSPAGSVLVALQFLLIAWLVWPFTPQHWSAPALALAAGALALGAWTLWWNRPGNFNIHPEPHARGQLVVGGPYRYLRHPMYAALLLFAAAEVVAYRDPWKLLASAFLFAVLFGKARIEERRLAERHPGYAAYAARVKRFVPGVF